MNEIGPHGSKTVMPNMTITAAELDALIAERDALRDELQVVKVERDLLQERLKAFLRKLFAAKSEARGSEQADLFLNEAEALAAGPDNAPAQEDVRAATRRSSSHQRRHASSPRGS